MKRDMRALDRRKLTFIIFIALSLFSTSSVGIASLATQEHQITFDPEIQKQVSAEFDFLSISLKRVEPCGDCIGKRRFVFEITDKLKGLKKEFAIGNETAQVDEIVIANISRAAIIGSVSGTVRAVNVVDLDVGSVIDFFYCHFPSISKNRRFTAYVKLLPRFSTPLSYIYLTYDLFKSPSQNRTQASQGRGDKINVGIPVYPMENLKSGLYEPINVNDESQAHTLASSSIFWLDEAVFAFVDRWKKANNLVVVDVSSGAQHIKVKVKPIDTMSVINPTQCSEEELENPEKLIYTREISVPTDKEGYVRLHFSPRGPCLSYSILDIALP